MSYINPHPDLPPLRPLTAVPVESRAADEKISRSTIVALVALTVALAAIGWGFTQWMSARDWRNRSQHIERTFGQLQTRATNAENERTKAQLAAEKTRTQLINAQNKEATLANQLAFAHDLRADLCTFYAAQLEAPDRARLCP